MRFWFDTEFIDNGKTIDLISIGIVSEDNRAYYAESSECDLSKACPWVNAFVIPKLSGDTKSRGIIASDIKEFCGILPEFWTYYGAYDWICMCQLYGRMIDTPASWPMMANDIVMLANILGKSIPQNNWSSAHNALSDAGWTRNQWMKLTKGEAWMNL